MGTCGAEYGTFGGAFDNPPVLTGRGFCVRICVVAHIGYMTESLSHRQFPTVEADPCEMPTSDQVGVASQTFQLLADGTRLRIVWALLHGERSVGSLALLVGASPSAVSSPISATPSIPLRWSVCPLPSDWHATPLRTCVRLLRILQLAIGEMLPILGVPQKQHLFGPRP